MGSTHGKAAGKPGYGTPPPGSPQKLTHYSLGGPGPAKGAALARTQREAYELDAADGVVDGKFYGAQIHIAPQDIPPTTAPAAANYHSLPAHGHATLPLHYNDARPTYPMPQNDYHGYRPQSMTRSTCCDGGEPYSSSMFPPASSLSRQGMPPQYTAVGTEPLMSSAYPPATSIGRQGMPQQWSAAGAPAPPCTGNSYEYTNGSYPMRNQSSMNRGFGGGPVAPPLPPAASLVPAPPPTPPKSFYDTYSRFAKVEFHTVAKSPYQQLLENQSRDIGQLVAQTGPVETPQPRSHQWMMSGTRAADSHQGHQPQHSSPMSQFNDIAARSAQPRAAAAEQHYADEQAPDPPAWDQDDPNQLGGFDADTSARNAFRRYDTDGNGFLDIYEFMAAMKALGLGTGFEEAKNFFSQIDVDSGGAIEEEEFVTWYLDNFKQIRDNMDPKKLAQNIFRKYDDDNSGALDVNEFVGAMQELGLGYTLEDAQFVFDTFDNDGGGTISEEEFVSQYYEQWLQQQS